MKPFLSVKGQLKTVINIKLVCMPYSSILEILFDSVMQEKAKYHINSL